jgi:hypothetical protein
LTWQAGWTPSALMACRTIEAHALQSPHHHVT